MTIEDHVTNLELSQKLKELGVPQNSLFFWVDNFRGIQLAGKDNIDIEWAIHPASNRGNWSAFIASELGKMLPPLLLSISSSGSSCNNDYIMDICKNYENKWLIAYTKSINVPPKIAIIGDNEPNARAKMLISLIENYLVKVEDLK